LESGGHAVRGRPALTFLTAEPLELLAGLGRQVAGWWKPHGAQTCRGWLARQPEPHQRERMAAGSARFPRRTRSAGPPISCRGSSHHARGAQPAGDASGHRLAQQLSRRPGGRAEANAWQVATPFRRSHVVAQVRATAWLDHPQLAGTLPPPLRRYKETVGRKRGG